MYLLTLHNFTIVVWSKHIILPSRNRNVYEEP